MKPNLVTTQIEPHDTYAELFDIIKRFNTISPTKKGTTISNGRKKIAITVLLKIPK